ncbi:proline-rich protein 36-like [Cervus elaphus]|uniref:proline-rich protein 36-like n=1 Tax=Cervus elaphus TaxID=9860 RepID=UPI001CC2FD20|nr:proline-rich protein 36-like [Cervus elaphus]
MASSSSSSTSGGLVSEPTKTMVKAEPIAVCKYAPRRGRGATVHGQATVDTSSTSVFHSREELARQTGIPEARIQVRSPPSAWAQAVAQETGAFSPAKPLELDTHMVSKPKSSAPPAERKGAWQWPGPRTRRRIGHDRSCSRGPKGPTRCPQHLSSPWPLADTGEHATLGCSRSFGRPNLLGARDCLWGAILPPLQPETHIRREPESPVGEGTAPLLEPQPHPLSLPSSTNLLDEVLAATGILEMQAPSAGAAADAGAHPALPGTPSFLEEFVEATGIPDTQAPSLGAAADAGVHPALPDAPSFLDELMEAQGITEWQAPSPGASADAGEHPALPGAPSFLEEFVEATGIPDTQAPSLGAAADAGVHPALPDAPSFLDELMEATGITEWQAPSPGAAAHAGEHPALPGAPSFLDELLEATAIVDSQAPSPGAAADAGEHLALPGAPIFLDELLEATGIVDSHVPSPGTSADAGVHPALPGAPSFLDELLEAMGIADSQAPSPGTAADAGVHPALPGAPSFLDELLEATGVLDTMGPSLGPSADAGAHLALPGSPSLQDELLAVTCIPGSLGPSLGSSPVIPVYHPALPESPSILDEIMAATFIQDTPWSSPGAAAGEEGVEAPRADPRLVSEPTKTMVKAEPIAVCKYAPRRGRGTTVHGQATVDTSSTSVFYSREELARQTGIPEARIQVRSPPSAWAQAVAQETGAFSPAKPLELDTRPRDSFAENGPAELTLGLPDQRTGGQAGCRMGATEAPTQESMPPLAAAAPLGAPTFWVPATASGVCVGQLLMFFVIQPSPVALQPRAILPPLQPETHIRREPESPVGEGTAPPLEPQPHPPSLPSSTNLLDEVLAATGILEMQAPSAGAAADAGAHPALPGTPSFLEEFVEATGIPDTQAPSLGAAADAGVHPALPDAPSFLDELMEAQGITEWQAPSPGASADAGEHPALPGAPSFLEELVEATGIPDTQAPSLGAAADAGVHPALPDAPSFLDELMEATGITEWQAPSPGAAAHAGVHPALPGAPSFLDELLEATAIVDSQAPSPGAAADAGEHLALPGAPIFLDELLEATGIVDSHVPSPGASADAGVHPALPGAPSFLDELLEAMGIADSQAPSPGTAADAGVHPALPGAPSFLDELLEATGVLDTMGPSLGPSADAGAQLALPGSPSLQDELLAVTCIPGSLGLVSEPTKTMVKAEPIAVCKYAPRRGRGATVHGQATVDTSSTSVFHSTEELARQTGIPEARIQVRSPPSAWAQAVAQETGAFSPAKPLELDTRPRDSFAENGPAELTLGLPDQRTGGQAGCRMGATEAPTQESMPPLAAAAPLGAPTFWVPATASGVCVGQLLMFFVIQPSPVALQPNEVLAATGILEMQASSAGAAADAGAHPALPGTPSFLEEFVEATGIPFLEEFVEATGIPDTQAPSLGALQMQECTLPCQTHPAF